MARRVVGGGGRQRSSGESGARTRPVRFWRSPSGNVTSHIIVRPDVRGNGLPQLNDVIDNIIIFNYIDGDCDFDGTFHEAFVFQALRPNLRQRLVSSYMDLNIFKKIKYK